MKNIGYLLLITVGLTATSCKKDLSTGELIAQELQEVINEHNIRRVINFRLDQNWDNTIIYGNYGTNYKFEGQFVVLDNEWYNLNSLIKYQIASKNSENGDVRFLLLSFY
jgi:hypothetical protein